MSTAYFALIANDNSPVEGYNLIVWASEFVPDNESEEKFIPLAAEYTDTDGSIIVSLPDGIYASAYVSITGHDGVQLPIALDEDGRFKKKTLLLVDTLKTRSKEEASENISEKKHCGFTLKKYEAVKQQRFIQLIRVEQPEVKRFEILDTVKLTEHQKEKIQEILSKAKKNLQVEDIKELQKPRKAIPVQV